MTKIRLLPCPLCGGDAEYKSSRCGEDCVESWVHCKRCGCSTDRHEDAYACSGPIHQWNDRFAHAAKSDPEFVARYLPAIFERLHEMSLNLANLQAAVQKLAIDVPAAIAAAAAGAGDAANQAAIDSITAQLTALDSTLASAAPAPTETPVN